MTLSRAISGWGIAIAMLALRQTCRVRLHDDPRKKLRAESQPYVYSVLHAHQVAAAIHREPNTAAMVSQSGDGELLMPAFWALGISPIRGSNRTHNHDRGGLVALDILKRHVACGAPALLAVDGPRGPRNHVRKGIALLAHDTGAAVLNVVAVPTRRWIFSKAWDRFQIPKPFCRIDAYFSEPLRPRAEESIEKFCRRVESDLNDLERKWDPAEASRALALQSI
jgi:lysophospholipid acyltransferase (LPLAT)-like uncharacterized protein